MPTSVKYQLKTVLLGLLAVPPMVSFAVALATAPSDSTVWSIVLAAVVALAVTVPFWLYRARRTDRPDRWLPALLPVAVVPGLYLLFWVITYAITGGLGDTLSVFVGALPYLILNVVTLFRGASLVIPVTLAAVLLGSVGGFVIGARDRRPAGRRSPAAVIAASVLLVALAAAQVGQQTATAMLLTGEPSMADEVELYAYRPFEPWNRLVSPDRPASLQLTADFPRLDGATALYPVYGAIGQATYVRPEGLGEEGNYQFVEEYLQCSTTSAAYDRLIAGAVDAIFVAQPSKGQLAKARAAGVELEVTPIGKEAFVFFVNSENPVRNLTMDQVRDIYSRRITNWRQLGGRDEAIVAFQRPEDSGSQTAMLALVMKDRAMGRPMMEERVSGMGGVISEVAGYRDLTGAIGYSFRWYATVMNSNPDISLVAIDGVEPTVTNIRNGSYPLIGNLNIVTAGTPQPNVRKLINWTVSAEGQALVEKVGYVGR